MCIALLFLQNFLEIDDNLVKLASFGAAGISVLAIFITGVIIYRLPNNVSKEKTGMLKYYLVACLIFALLTAASGILNALFNKAETEAKEAEKAEVVRQYEQEARKWVEYRGEVDTRIANMQQALQAPAVNTGALAKELKELRGATGRIQPRPLPQ